MKKISVVISAYNEEKKIEDCLKSVVWADEIILVDNSSDDATAKIAQKYTSKIFTQPNRQMLNTNKNYGFSKATGDWIISLDADERVTPELKKEIESRIPSARAQGEGKNQESRINGYWVPRKNIIFGKWIQSDMWWPDYQLRFFKNGKGKFPEKHVHEYIEITGETARLKEPLIHYNYSSLAQFLYKMDKIYTEDEANRILASHRKLGWIDAIRFPIDDFLKTFFARKGYRDGLHGLVLSFLQAFYAEIVFVKVWEKQGFIQKEYDKNFLHNIGREFKKISNEFKYWLLTSFMEEAGNLFKRILYRLLRKYHKKD